LLLPEFHPAPNFHRRDGLTDHPSALPARARQRIFLLHYGNLFTIRAIQRDATLTKTTQDTKVENDQSTLVLSDKRWLHIWKATLIPLLLFLVVMTVAAVLALTAIFPDAPWDKLPTLLVARLSTVDWAHALLGHLDQLIIFMVVLGQFLYLGRVQKLERLTLSPEGIGYTSPLPRMLKRFKPDWSLAWDQIQKAEVGSFSTRMRNPEFALLTLISGTNKRQIFPVHWVDANNYSRPAFNFTFKLAAPTCEEIFSLVMKSEVMRYISVNAPHISINPKLGQAEVFTSLEKNPHGRKALGIVALLILYAIIDFIAGPDSYVDEPAVLLPVFVSAGVAAAILIWFWLYRSTLPMNEKTGLAMLIGMLFAVAMVPGALRINALTDTQGASTYDYYVTQSANGVVLQPVVDGMPVIEYFAKKQFWAGFGKYDTYPVQIRKGALDFYQFNSSVIVDDIRQHEAR
jgi:hypothetical protein